MIIKFLKKLKNWTDPNYWGQQLGEKTGAFEKAENSTFTVSYTHLTLPTNREV